MADESNHESDIPTSADDAVRKLVSAQRTFALYPARNPKVYASVGLLREELQKFPPEGPLELQVGRDSLYCGEFAVLPGVNELRELAKKLYLAHVTMLILTPAVTDDELIAFLGLMRLSDDDRRELGSLGDELSRQGVENIVVREAGRVTIEEVTQSGTDNPWDLASLEQLEALEDRFLGEQRSGFHEAFRAVDEGHDPKAGRLLGLLERPADFATLLLETASQQRQNGGIDLDAQLAVTIDLVSRLEPMLKKAPEADRPLLYSKMTEVVTIIEHAVYRELMEVVLPPYVRIGKIKRLFPDQLRPMTVKEALSLGLGPGMMPMLMAGLRRIAQGDDGVPAFLSGNKDGVVEADEDRGPYRPVLLPPAPPAPVPLGARFFEPQPNGKRHPGEIALADGITQSDAVFDSIATLVDLLASETDREDYQALSQRMVRRFKRTLESRNFVLASQVLSALAKEQERCGADEARADLAPLADAAVEMCGTPEMINIYVEALDGVGDADLDKALEPLARLSGNAVESLMDLLADEQRKETRLKILTALFRFGQQHVDKIASYGTHPEWYVVRNVVCILGAIAGGVAPRLMQMSKHPEPRVRREVVRSLCQCTDPEVVPALTEFVGDESDAVVRDAVHKLVELNATASVPALLKELRSPKFGARHPATIATVIRALGSLGDATARTQLEAMAKSSDATGALASPRARKLVTDAAAQIADRLARGAGGSP